MENKTEHCPNCGAPCTYSGIGCDYYETPLQAAAPELLRMLRIARTRIMEMAVLLEDANPVLYDDSQFAIDNDLNRIDDEIKKATGN